MRYRIIDPSLSEAELARHLEAFDPRYYTSYYAIDAVNFKPVDLSSALNTLDAPYIPLLVQEAAGVPLDPSFAEQKKILQTVPRPVLSLQWRRGGEPV